MVAEETPPDSVAFHRHLRPSGLLRHCEMSPQRRDCGRTAGFTNHFLILCTEIELWEQLRIEKVTLAQTRGLSSLIPLKGNFLDELLKAKEAVLRCLRGFVKQANTVRAD